ncbi:hypothetical protein RHGRI_038138 [Rhododendron griersonianum]|uniref:Uncharacterized protein n=1 Tax=Rhododendron griersonianum TaxID=479676 RepID=A0AAV6HYR3_9ERIC|nr:hypothetical protein RHGRI_038138 [Rhododendron griersonianum]
MAATASSAMHITAARPSISSTCRIFKAGVASVGAHNKGTSWAKLASTCHISSVQSFRRNFMSSPAKFEKFPAKAMSGSGENKPSSGLPIDLKAHYGGCSRSLDQPKLKVFFIGKRAFIAGIADDSGYGWAIAKSLAAAGAEILVGTWVPALNMFETSLRRGKFDESLVLPDGSLMKITKVYALDAVFDNPEDVPEDIKANKRYAGSSNWTVQEVAECVKQDFGSIDILVHSLANGPEEGISGSNICIKLLLSFSAETFYSNHEPRHASQSKNLIHGGSSVSLTYIASERIIPGYGGGMSSAKAALESDTRMLAFEAGRKHKIRVNTISADEVGNTAAFLASPLASAITGAVIFVDNGLNAMGMAVDSPIIKTLDIPTDKH